LWIAPCLARRPICRMQRPRFFVPARTIGAGTPEMFLNDRPSRLRSSRLHAGSQGRNRERAKAVSIWLVAPKQRRASANQFERLRCSCDIESEACTPPMRDATGLPLRD